MDTELWVYDSTRTAIVDYGNDDTAGGGAPSRPLTRPYAGGTFHLALSSFNFANNLGSPVDDNFRTGVVVDSRT